MATRFIAFVPKPPKEKRISKSFCKSTLEESSTSNNNQNDFLIQKVNRHDGIIVEESLTEICKSSNGGDEDEDDTYLPTIQELIAGQGVSGGHAPNAIEKPALGDDDCSINRPDSRNSQDKPIPVGEDEQADLSDFQTNSTKSTTGRLESRQASLDTTISPSSNPQAGCEGTRAAKLRKNDTFMTEMAHSKRVRSSLKRKTRSIWGEGPGDLLESRDNSSSSDDSDSDSDSDNGSETKSEFDNRPVQKKQKTDNSQHGKKDRSTSGFQTTQTVWDELPAADDTELEYTMSCQDPFNGQDPYDGAIKLLATVCDGELEYNDYMDGGPKEDANIVSVPQHATAAMVSQELIAAIDGQSTTLAPTALMKSVLDDSAIPPQVAAVDAKQEWEICDIVGKKFVDGVPHYWVQWSVTLVPKSEMGKARALVARFEAELRAQRKPKGGKGQGKLLPSKAGKQAAAGVHATAQTQEKKRRGRPRKRV